MGKPLTQKELNQLKNNPSIYWDLLAARTNKSKDQVQAEATVASGFAVGVTVVVAVGPEVMAAMGLKGTVSTGGLNYINIGMGAGGLLMTRYLAVEASAGASKGLTGILDNVSNSLGGALNGTREWWGNLGKMPGPTLEHRDILSDKKFIDFVTEEYNRNLATKTPAPPFEIDVGREDDETCYTSITVYPHAKGLIEGSAEMAFLSVLNLMETDIVEASFKTNITSGNTTFTGVDLSHTMFGDEDLPGVSSTITFKYTCGP
jgi:hypothetical protein